VLGRQRYPDWEKRILIALTVFLLALLGGCGFIADRYLCREVVTVPALSPDGAYWARSRSYGCMLTPTDSSVTFADAHWKQRLDNSPFSGLADLAYLFNGSISCGGNAPTLTWMDARTLLVDDRRCAVSGRRPTVWRDVLIHYQTEQAP
jgi:hypothetical protein